MEIKVLGSGCSKCTQLYDMVHATLGELGLTAEVSKVSDMRQIASFGVMRTPALVVDGKVKIVGKVPTADELKSVLGE